MLQTQLNVLTTPAWPPCPSSRRDSSRLPRHTVKAPTLGRDPFRSHASLAQPRRRTESREEFLLCLCKSTRAEDHKRELSQSELFLRRARHLLARPCLHTLRSHRRPAHHLR